MRFSERGGRRLGFRELRSIDGSHIGLLWNIIGGSVIAKGAVPVCASQARKSDKPHQTLLWHGCAGIPDVLAHKSRKKYKRCPRG